MINGGCVECTEGMKNGRIPVFFATNDAYAPYAGVCIGSVLDNSPDGYFDFYILHTGLSESLQAELCGLSCRRARVECVDVSDRISSLGERIYTRDYFTKEMYYRFLIPEICTDRERAIYLDCDMIVRSDLAELMSVDMQGAAIAGCRNLMHSRMHSYVSRELGIDPLGYINSGMLVMDILACRSMDLTNRMSDELSRRPELRYPDQDLINIIFCGRIRYLPAEWNYLWHLERLERSAREELRLLPEDRREFRRAGKNVRIIHYTGDRKPWFYNGIGGSDTFWSYAKTSPFYRLIKERFVARNKGMQKIRLVFADFKGGSLELTCSYEVLADECKDSFLFAVNNDIYSPTVYAKRRTVRDGVRLTQRLFTVRIPLERIRKGRVKLCFTVNGRCVLFEYDKYFPLNGCPRSYFAFQGIVLYRNGKELVLERCSRHRRMLLELRYLWSLVTSSLPRRRKYFFVRLLYFLTRPFISKNIWLISDRPGVAGDNGEALFRYICQSPELRGKVRAYYVISGTSGSFRRLSGIGSVVRMSSFRHKLLALHAAVKAVSQTDAPLYEVIVRDYIKDLRYREVRVFLQHGITKDDISRLYSRFSHGFDLFVTAANREWESIVSNPGYGCGPSIACLTGFPRHDLLEDKRDRIVVIAPTWRRELDAEAGGDAQTFLESDYYAVWHGLVAEGELTRLARENGYEVWLLLHDRMRPYAGLFADACEGVRIVDTDMSFSEMFSRGALMITDYSSNAFEFAYLKKPLIYYQPDHSEFFGRHTYDRGYFDYKRDGFGEVAESEEELLDAFRAFLARGGVIQEKYEERIRGFFAFSDRNNSARVVAQILKKIESREGG